MWLALCWVKAVDMLSALPPSSPQSHSTSHSHRGSFCLGRLSYMKKEHCTVVKRAFTQA